MREIIFEKVPIWGIFRRGVSGVKAIILNILSVKIKNDSSESK